MEKATCLSVFLVLVLLSGSHGIPQRDSTLLDTSDECKGIMDIAILADISESMKGHHREELIKIVNDLVDKLTVSEAGNHFGLITFGDIAKTHNTFADKDYHIAQNFKDSVTEELQVYPGKEATRTDLAEDLAVKKLFTKEGGDRPNAINVMLILTDGKPFINEEDKEKGISFLSFLELTKELERKKVSIMVVGIGEDAQNNEADMYKTAGKKGEVFLHKDFAELSEKLYKQFKDYFCAPVDGKYTNWFPASNCSVMCGGGVRIIRRTCTNPPPSNGGKNCTGPAEKTVSCNERKCATCLTDVAFIVDSSGSIHGTNFHDAKKVVKNLVMTLDLASSKDRAALVLFSSKASLEARFGQYGTVNRFLNFVQKLPKMGGRTRIDRALNRTVNEVFPEARQEAYKIAIVLTDGVQSIGARGLQQTSQPLRDAGVRLLAVGVGTGMNKRRLRLMTDSYEDVVNVKNIQGRFQKILDELSQHACTPPPRAFQQGKEFECIDEPIYARRCQEKANEGLCWSHPDFSAVNCPVTCNLCVSKPQRNEEKEKPRI